MDFALDLDTQGDGLPQRYQLEGDVEDVSRQHIANRNSLLVHPAPFYVGVRRPPYFSEQKTGLDTEIVTVGLDGKPVGGIPVEITLTQMQWKSVRRAEGDGFYTWDTELVEIPSGKRLWGTPKPVSERPAGNGTAFILLRVNEAEPPAVKRDLNPASCRTRFRMANLGK